MRSLFKLFLFVAGVTFLLVACDKADDLKTFGNGAAVALTSSASTVAPLPADSNNVALRLNWTSPNYATDSANYKFTIEIDSTGKNFANAASKVVTKSLGGTFTAKELNDILLAKGYAFNVPVDMDVRVISSYANNNERLTSNVLKIRMTPYKVPPKVALPTSGRLFIVGGATQGGWANPVPAPSQELTRIDETTWGGIFMLTADQSYLLLPVNTNVWDVKYGGTGGNNSNNPVGDNFKEGGSDMKAPAATGWYKLMFDFQAGRFTATPVANALPTDLYITGDATAAGWTNTPPAPQKFTRLTNSVFEIPSIALAPGKVYKFLSSSGNWQPQFGGSSAAGGTLGANYGSGTDPDSVPTPAAAGNYKIQVNFFTNTYTVTKL